MMRKLLKNQAGVNTVLIIVAILAVIVILAFIFANPSGGPSNGQPSSQVNKADINQELEAELGIQNADDGEQTTEGEDDQPTPEATAGKQFTIVYSDDGFTPSSITVSQSDIVKFVNQSSRSFWPASVVHPTHTIYPGSSISKCDSAESDQLFDACRVLAPGEDYSFIFIEVGNWGYHNHLRPSSGGLITVN